jgi:hypothetical protein
MLAEPGIEFKTKGNYLAPIGGSRYGSPPPKNVRFENLVAPNVPSHEQLVQVWGPWKMPLRHSKRKVLNPIRFKQYYAKLQSAHSSRALGAPFISEHESHVPVHRSEPLHCKPRVLKTEPQLPAPQFGAQICFDHLRREATARLPFEVRYWLTCGCVLQSKALASSQRPNF